MLAIGTELGGYRIEGILGQGGMGVVYQARQLSLGRLIALKLLSSELSSDSGFRERFRREGRLQASLDHPNIVTVHEAGELDGHLFLAMQLIRGITLKEAIEGGNLDPAAAVVLLGGVGAALDAAHEARLIHRDVKPRNVLIDRRNHPYLADFGLIKAPGEATLTKTGHFMGTVSYIAPEQIRGEDATAASDIYSLCGMLFECLTGRVPYPRPNEAAVINAHMSEPPPRVTEVRPGMPPALDDVIAAGLAKDPAERPPTARRLIDAAAEALGETTAAPVGVEPSADEPTTATVPTADERPPERTTEPLVHPDTAQLPPAAPPAEPTRWRRAGLLVAAGLVAVAVAALLIAGGDGGGPPVTLGGALPADGTTEACSGGGPEPCTIAQTALRGGTLEAPSDGTITEWTVELSEGTLSLVTLGPDYRLLARSEPEGVSGSGTFDADVPIVEGGRVGLELEQGSMLGLASAPGARLARWEPPLEDDEQREASYREPVNLQILLSARFEPDS